jgi:hypothetical protein
VLLIVKPDMLNAQFWRKTDNSYFRKSGMAFKNEAIMCDKRIKFNGMYKSVDPAFGYSYLIFYPNGLMTKSGNSFKSKKLVYPPNASYRNWNDTILRFNRDFKSTMGGKFY